jgi:hypothetical protein
MIAILPDGWAIIKGGKADPEPGPPPPEEKGPFIRRVADHFLEEGHRSIPEANYLARQYGSQIALALLMDHAGYEVTTTKVSKTILQDLLEILADDIKDNNPGLLRRDPLK